MWLQVVLVGLGSATVLENMSDSSVKRAVWKRFSCLQVVCLFGVFDSTLSQRDGFNTMLTVNEST